METATFGLLGPVEVRVPGCAAAALPPSVRVLLARLALSPGRVVSADALTDALWGEDLPADAANALQIRVSKLRRALVGAGVPGEVLLTRAPGYQLAVPPEAVDAHRLEHLVTRARRLVADGKREDALTALDQALALWRGPALAEGDFDASAAEWELWLGQAHQIQHVVMESAMWSHLGIALRESGRGREAVAALRRAVAVDEHGGSLHGLAFALVHLAHTLLGSGEGAEASDLLVRANEVARRVQNPRCQAWAAWGRARLSLADGHPDLAVEECRRATDLLRNGEFPWAMAQLWQFLAEAATAAGETQVAADARAQARQVAPAGP